MRYSFWELVFLFGVMVPLVYWKTTVAVLAAIGVGILWWALG